MLIYLRRVARLHSGADLLYLGATSLPSSPRRCLDLPTLRMWVFAGTEVWRETVALALMMLRNSVDGSSSSKEEDVFLGHSPEIESSCL